ncbi:MAG: FAD binding domain-containing protein [Devosia sp.]
MAFEVLRVDSVKAAAALLASDGGARFIGGGTIAVRDVNYGDGSVSRLVLPEGLKLDLIQVEAGKASLGAAVTMAKVEAHPQLGFLKPVAHSIGGPAIRAMATVGGNLFAPYPFGDFTVAMLALGAVVTVEGSKGPQTLDLEDFLSRTRNPAKIVVSLAFELPDALRFTKVVRRKPHGASVLSVAAVLPIVGGVVSGARIAYGAMGPRPMRARAVEAALEGRTLEAVAIAAAVKQATVGCAPLTDPQASAWYRNEVLPIHLQRLLSA